MPRYTVLNTCVITLVLTSIGHAQAQTYYPDVKRDGKWDFALQLRYEDEFDATGKNASSFEAEEEIGWGFQIGYNFDEHWNLGFEMGISNADYTAVLAPDTPSDQPITIDHEMDNFTYHLNLTYHLFTGKFTPFVMGGLGWSYLDSNVADGPPVTGCWWDPWYGYVCNNYYDSYDDTAFSYNAGAGLRWEIMSNFFMRASVSRVWIDVGKAKGTPDLNVGRLEVGWMY